jgi:hypothetical protein
MGWLVRADQPLFDLRKAMVGMWYIWLDYVPVFAAFTVLAVAGLFKKLVRARSI